MTKLITASPRHTSATDMVRSLTERELNAASKRIREGDEFPPEYAYAVSAESRRRRTERPLSDASNGELFESLSEACPGRARPAYCGLGQRSLVVLTTRIPRSYSSRVRPVFIVKHSPAKETQP